MNEERMDFKEFADTVRDNIRDYLPESYKDAEVKIEEFQKLNDSYIGMQVKNGDQTVVPTINLDKHFQRFQREGANLAGMDGVLHTIAREVQSQLELDTEWLKDYSQVKDKLYIRVSDAKQNAFVLKNTPHQEVDGLAVSCHIAFEDGQGIRGALPVTYDMIQMYGITQEQLHRDALENSVNLLPVTFVSLGEMMSRMTGTEMDMTDPGVPPIMVLTNDQALHGAGALFYPGQMDAIAGQLGTDYFVLPSSIHELLILPDDGTMDPGVLREMVQDVNAAVVSPEEVLSDHVYHYDAKDHVLEKAETFELRMESKEMEAEKAAQQTAQKPREDKMRSGHSAEKHADTPKKERRSVLARLNEKKDQVKAQPHKDVPAKNKETML